MLLDIYRECCFNRYFEYKVAEDIKNKKITCPTYLSVGSEYIPVILKYALKELNITKYSIFPQHRCHSYHNTFIQKPLELVLELHGHKNGCNKGYGGSASIGGENNGFKMWNHDGLLGSNAPIATGYAQASKEFTVCILGDGAVEEDYVLGALGYAGTHKIPILFIIEDNNLSILTEKKDRRSWDILSVASSFGIMADQVLYNNKASIPLSFNAIKQSLKYAIKRNASLLNIECYRHFWHVGAGIDKISYDYLDTFEKYLLEKNLNSNDLLLIKNQQQQKINDIWIQLETLLKN